MHVGDHRLERFFADFGEVARLVDHAAALTAHAEGTGLAGVFGSHGLPEFKEAACFFGFAKGVGDSGPAAAGADFFHGSLVSRRMAGGGLAGRAINYVILQIMHFC